MRRTGGLALALCLAGCAPLPLTPSTPSAPVPAGSAITIAAEPIPGAAPGNPSVCAAARRDCWAFAGGVHLTSADTSRLHGLSDVEVTPGGRLIAINDVGDLLQARVVLDPDGRLQGLADATLVPLAGLQGEPIAGKRSADAEGLATLASGDRLISFEVVHRVWLYPADSGRPRAASSPTAVLAENGGMEALSADPERGRDAYLVGAEESGRTWLCRLSTACIEGPRLEMPSLFGLVAARRLSKGRTAWLLRAYDPLRGNRIEIRITDPRLRTIRSLHLARPDTVDNFEGLAAVELPDGRIRFYLLSDDNFARSQRTLLVAYDWRPPRRMADARPEPQTAN